MAALAFVRLRKVGMNMIDAMTQPERTNAQRLQWENERMQRKPSQLQCDIKALRVSLGNSGWGWVRFPLGELLLVILFVSLGID